MSKIYCGIGEPPKGHKVGTMGQCAEKGQIRRYGLYKIDPKVLDNLKDKPKSGETRNKLLIKMAETRGKLSKLEKEKNREKDKSKVKTLDTQMDKLKVQLKQIFDKVKAMENKK